MKVSYTLTFHKMTRLSSPHVTNPCLPRCRTTLREEIMLELVAYIVVNLSPFLHPPSHATHHTHHTPSHTFTCHTPHTPHTLTHHTPSHSLSAAVALPVVLVPPAEEENFVSSLSGNLISRREREREREAEERGKEREKNKSNATQLGVPNNTSQVRVLLYS